MPFFKSPLTRALSLLLFVLLFGVIGYRDENGKQFINPDASLSLSIQGKLIALGSGESIKKLNQMFQLD